MNFANFAPGQRVDLTDMQSVAQEGALGVGRETTAYFASQAQAQQGGYILSGFAATNPTGNQIQVALGAALLARRVGLQVQYGILTATGDVTQAIDVTAFAAGIYGVFVKFVQIPGATQSRTFWQASDTSPGEYAQSTQTQLLSNWQMTITPLTPGPEWLQVASVSLPSNTITDMRPLYFEGRPDLGYVSSWGSGTNDRSANRANYPVGDLQTFASAMRTAIEDVKGPGLTRWWEAKIGGQNIGFTGNAVLSRTAWGDANFYAQGSVTTPSLALDADTSLGYNRTSKSMTLTVNGTAALLLSATAMSTPDAFGVGTQPAFPLHVASGTGGALALFDTLGASGVSALVKLQATAGTTSLQFAAGGTTTLFEQRSTYGSALSTLGTYAGATLAASLDSQQRWIFGPSTVNYAYPTSPATLTVADTTGNTLLRLDSSATNGVAAALSLRANNANTLIRFTPAATSVGSTASFMLQASQLSFSLMDIANGNNAFNYSASTRVLDFSGSLPTSPAYYITNGYTLQNKANIYGFIVPTGSKAVAGAGLTGGFIGITGSGLVYFPLQVYAGSTITTITLSTIRSSTSTSNYNASITLYATPTGSGNGATALASASSSLAPTSAGTKYTLSNVAMSVATSSYQNFYIAFADSDPNAYNGVFQVQFYCTQPYIPAGQL